LQIFDDTRGTSETIKLVGDFTSASWNITADGSGGVDITDPQPASSPTSSFVESAVVLNGVAGTIDFANSNSQTSHNVGFTPEGANYVGTFSVGHVTEQSGSSTVEFTFSLDQDQLKFATDEVVTQSYDVQFKTGQSSVANQTVSVSIGGPANDNFVFHPGVGADTIIHFDPQDDTIELDKFATVQTQAQLASLITTNVHGDAVIDLGHGDSVTVPGLTKSYLQAHLESLVHVH
jgi:hypothetical protein